MPFKGHTVGICKDFQCYTTELMGGTERRENMTIGCLAFFTALRSVADGRTDRLR